MKESKLNIPPWNKGKKGLFKHSEETKQKMMGHETSIKTRQKIRETYLKWLSDPENYKKLVSRLNTIRRPTSIEKSVHEELIRRGIFNFVPEFHISNGNGKSYFIDFMILPNICIECDGDYWHNVEGAKESDQIRDSYLTSQGYKILRFTETEINNNLQTVGDKIEECIK